MLIQNNVVMSGSIIDDDVDNIFGIILSVLDCAFKVDVYDVYSHFYEISQT